MFKVNKKLIAVLLLFSVLGAGYFYKDRVVNYIFGLPQIKKPIEIFFSDVENVAKEVFTPPPLRVEKEVETTLLTRNGIVLWTNIHRAENGLVPLSENTRLVYAAVEKLNDMFENQYFAHVSPAGLGVTHWVDRAGYEYLIVGENLALGNFEDDADLVQAWMDSPGHRKNILGNYTEIGAATGRGIFEGRQTWLAVQVFGRPVSDCPQPSVQLQSEINIYETNIKSTENSLTFLKIQIERIAPARRAFKEDYSELVNEYNALVAQYNGLVEEFQTMIEEYNGQVKEFNNCVQTNL